MNEFLMTLAVAGVHGSLLEWLLNRLVGSPQGDNISSRSRVPGALLLSVPFLSLAHWLWNWPASLAAGLGTLAYFAASDLLHRTLHSPRRSWFRELAWFRFLRAHHIRHHLNESVNYNVLCPLGDLLFGTFSFRRLNPETEEFV